MYRRAWRRWAVGAAVAAAAALPLAQTQPPAVTAQSGQSWEVLAGSDMPAESLEGTGFFPTALTVNVGDTVTWAFRGFHSILFNAGRPPLEVVTPGPGPGDMTIGPAFFPFPPGPSAPSGPYDGSQQINSGAPLDPSAGPPSFALTFTRAGAYAYTCPIHPGMDGVINVAPVGAALPETPAQASARGQAELGGAIGLLKGALLPAIQPATATVGGATVHSLNAGIGSANGMSAVQFLPGDYRVKRGDVVVWTNADPKNLHTVTFLAGGPTPPELEIQPQPGGPPLIFFPARVAAPQGNGVFTGGNYVNSGLLFGGGTFALRIDAAPGTYEYLCMIHSGALAEGGGGPPMKGRLIVE